ncbi:MAG: hypothetical protein PHX80_04430 [Candidatus Nanoarchaeia archaeon]|nr:hypothetical protein [Candidatus Nanoarchaeia archaeon]
MAHINIKCDFKTRRYKNAYSCNFKDRKIIVIHDNETGDYYLEFEVLDNNNHPRAGHIYAHGLTITTIRLSPEAMDALLLAMCEMKNIDDLHNELQTDIWSPGT